MLYYLFLLLLYRIRTSTIFNRHNEGFYLGKLSEAQTYNYKVLLHTQNAPRTTYFTIAKALASDLSQKGSSLVTGVINFHHTASLTVPQETFFHQQEVLE